MRQFKGTIADKKLSDFNQYDNKLTKHKDRIHFVKEHLYNEENVHDFFATYFDEYYAVSPNQEGFLAEEDAVCKLLEILGTYILNANDVDSNRKIEYRFWKSEREYRDYKQSQTVAITSSSDDGKEVEIIDMFVDNKDDKNQKIVKAITVDKKDVRDIEEIRQLENAIDYLKSQKGLRDIRERALELLEGGKVASDEQDRLKYIAKNTERYIDKYVKALRESQVLIKKAIKRPIEFKSILKDEGAPNKLDACDFMEKKDVKALLPYLSREDLTTDFGILVFDLNKLIDETELSPKEADLVNMYRKGFSKSEASFELGVKSETTNKMMNRISLKVVKTYETKLENYRELKRLKKI